MEEDKNKIQTLIKEYNDKYNSDVLVLTPISQTDDIDEETGEHDKCEICNNDSFTSIIICWAGGDQCYFCRECLQKQDLSLCIQN